MIVIALMILPLMGIEFLITHDTFESNGLLHSRTLCATGIIWLAFTTVFVVMISMVENKLRYCRDHWIDLAIIFLPTIAFLRCFRVIRLQQMLKF